MDFKLVVCVLVFMVSQVQGYYDTTLPGYKGCWKFDGKSEMGRAGIQKNDINEPEDCIKLCGSKGFKYAGTWNGYGKNPRCYCGDIYDDRGRPRDGEKNSQQCFIHKCAQSTKTGCGYAALIVYEAQSSSTTGVTASAFNNNFDDSTQSWRLWYSYPRSTWRSSPGWRIGSDTASFYTGPSIEIDYKGCYRYRGSMGWKKTWILMTPLACVETCDYKNYKYAAIWKKYCYCGRYLPYSSSKVSDSSCDHECVGDLGRGQYCGGGDLYRYYSVYQTSGIKRNFGRFAYCEMSNSKKGTKYYLRTKEDVSIRNSDMCLHFKYHMFGFGMGKLEVMGKNYKVIWSRSGDHGNIWNQANEVPLDVGSYKISFVATNSGSWASDMAIDDVKIGRCTNTNKCANNVPCRYCERSTSSKCKCTSNWRGHGCSEECVKTMPSNCGYTCYRSGGCWIKHSGK